MVEWKKKYSRPISNAEKRRINKLRKEREKDYSPAKKMAKGVLEVMGLPMYHKIERKEEGKGKIARKQQLNKNNKRP